ncbi:EthD domain-containing protein [Fusarium falciforme]|uniref:EthD domain-containing protein n=1 Tax=Fusarium falciforme TaxID=195108 RepID=UPI00230198BC|nr:EthD domain-containing protein [Fusarium falciforme]WAO92368.1 EthD domain-containing protein [Fusarium falciforme]
MPYHVLMLAYRKPTLSPKEFYHHYETIHIPLVKSLAGVNFPLSHTRRYIQRSGAKEQEGEFPALLLSGSQQDFDYDVMIELSFEDEEAFYRFGRTMGEPDVQAAVADDCAKFMDQNRSKAVVLGSIQSTAQSVG